MASLSPISVPDRPPADAVPDPVSRPRHIPFRVVAGLVALVFLVMFGVWQSILTPWVLIPDDVDHGWLRTPAAHRYADAAAAVAMAAVAIGAVVAALRPASRSGLAAWVGATLVVIGVSSAVSVLLQQHTDVTGALVQGAVVVALTALPFVLTHPQRRWVGRGGVPGDRPSRGARLWLVTLGVAGVLLVVAALVWRLSGGIVEDPREDDVLSFVILGTSVAVGAWVCVTGRAGWRALTVLMTGIALYAVVGGLSIALG